MTIMYLMLVPVHDQLSSVRGILEINNIAVLMLWQALVFKFGIHGSNFVDGYE